jgi:O-antigen ligase
VIGTLVRFGQGRKRAEATPVDYALRPSGNPTRLLAIVLLGFGLSLALQEAWDLDTRWLVIVFVAVIAIAISMCFARVFSDFVLIVTLFSLPFASFIKWIWLSGYDVEDHGNVVYVGVLGIGLMDFLLVGLYMSWFHRIFITHEQPLPRLNLLDGFIIWLIVAYLVATIDARGTAIGLAATEYLFKHFLFYFYLSRNLAERHLPWLLAAFAFTIFLEVSLGTYQFATGRLLGLALDKGAALDSGGGSLNLEVVIPGTESYHRATGTSYDPHTLGNFVALILPFALVLCFTPRLRPALRLGCLAAAAGAVLVVLLSVSRTAWLSTATALPIGIVLIVAIWRERQVVPAVAAAAVAAAIAMPFILSFTSTRFQNYSFEALAVRFDQYKVAWRVFTLHPLFGVGPGNWIWAYPRYDFMWLVGDDPSRNVVHNVMLWIGVEVGIFGLIAYIGILVTTMVRLFALVRQRRDIPARLGLAALIAMITTELCGLTDPGYREPNSYMMFWLVVSLSVALPRLRPGAGGILMSQRRPTIRSGPIPAAVEAQNVG